MGRPWTPWGGGVAIAYKKQTNKCKPLSSKAGSRCSRFKHSQMTHFITRFSTFRVRFRRIGMRGRDCRVESPHCSIITQLIISSVSHYMKSKDFVLNRTIKFYNLLTYFILPKKCSHSTKHKRSFFFVLLNFFLYPCDSRFVSYWHK